MNLQVVIVIVRRMMRAARSLRLVPTVITTAPLWLLPLLAVLPALESYKLKRVDGWPDRGAPAHAQLKLTHLKDAFAGGFFPQPNPHVHVINLHLHELLIDALNENLPLSGFVEKRGTIETADGFERIKLRYQGDNAYHWFYPKKSWRLKTKKTQPLEIGRKLSLVNPKDSQFIIQYVDWLIAKRFELLTSPVTMATVNLNRKYHGLYVMQPTVDETLLRQSRQMPGDIWSGDGSVRYGEGHEFGSDPHIWRRSAESNSPAGGDEPALHALVRQVNMHEYWAGGRRLFDEAYMARFCAFVSLIGTSHYDSDHNLHLYFEPLSGQFRMIERDSIGLTFDGSTPDRQGLDITSNPFFVELLRHPRFCAAKNRYLYQQLRDGSLVETLTHEIQAAAERLDEYVRHDQRDRHGFNFRGPGDFDEAVVQIVEFLRRRAEYLLSMIGDAQVGYAWQSGLLKLDAGGYGPSGRFRLTFDRPIDATISVYQQRAKGKLTRVPHRHIGRNTIEIDDTIYPGRLQHQSSTAYAWYMRPAPLTYLFQIEGGGAQLTDVSADNVITGRPAKVRRSDNWAQQTNDSIHPWSEAQSPQPQVQRISGLTYVVTEDWIVPPHETVIFEPGVTVQLAPGASIISYGRLIAEGAADRPIVFGRRDALAPWGVLAVNGQSAGGSRFTHVTFRGGSHDLIDRVYYSGMVSVHHAGDVRFDDCRFADNTIGDDALRVGQAQVDVINCVFVNAAGDGVDYDYGRGTLRGNHFEKTGNDAIDLMTSDPLIVDNVIKGAGDKGISIGEHSQPIIINTQIESAHIGIESKDASRPLIVNVHLRGCRAAVNAYVKNWRYNDGGHAQLYNSIIENCAAAVTVDKRSDVGLTHCALVNTPPPPVNKRVSVIDCTQSVAARPAPFALIYRELGMPSAASIGLDTPGAAIKPMPVVFRTRFREDFTSNLDGWRAADGGDAFKSAKALVVRARNGRAAVIERELDNVSAAAGLFIFEARTTTPATGWVVFDGQAKHRSRVELNEAYTRQTVVVPDMKLRRIALHLPADQRTYIRLLELRAPEGHGNDSRGNNRHVAKGNFTHRPNPSSPHGRLASTDQPSP